MTWHRIPAPNTEHLRPKRQVGLGDAVEKVAQPIAKAVDRVFGTNIQECGSCKERKVALNDAFPNLTELFRRRDRNS